MKIKIIFICLIMSLLSSCSNGNEYGVLDMLDFALDRLSDRSEALENNPMAGLDKNERVLFILHETYPEHTFYAVEPVETFTDSGVYEDENGLQFEVDSIYNPNSYQMGIYDDYLYETLMAQGILEKVEDIISKYGYEMDFSEDNRHLSFEVDITGLATKPEDILAVIKEINALDIYTPTCIFISDTSGFSTGEINFYSLSKMESFNVDLKINQEKMMVSDAIIAIPFGSNMHYTDEDLLEYIMSAYWLSVKHSDLNIMYQPEAYIDIEDDMQGFEVVDENTNKRIRRYMTYEIPASFKFGRFEVTDNGDDYYDPEHSDVHVANHFRFNGMLNEIEISSAMYEFRLTEKEEFRADIEADINKQIGQREDVEFVSIEEFPDEDHVVYKVELKEMFGATTNQYYIMGDGMFALLDQTYFNEQEYYDEVAANIIKSFSWQKI